MTVYIIKRTEKGRGAPRQFRNFWQAIKYANRMNRESVSIKMFKKEIDNEVPNKRMAATNDD